MSPGDWPLPYTIALDRQGHLYFIGQPGRVAVAGIADAHGTASYSGSSISPDGKTILVMTQDALGINVYSIAPGQPDRALTADSGVRSALSWLPDDHRFSISTLGRDTSAFYRTDVVDVVTGRSRKMPLPPSIATIADAAFVR